MLLIVNPVKLLKYFAKAITVYSNTLVIDGENYRVLIQLHLHINISAVCQEYLYNKILKKGAKNVFYKLENLTNDDFLVYLFFIKSEVRTLQDLMNFYPNKDKNKLEIAIRDIKKSFFFVIVLFFMFIFLFLLLKQKSSINLLRIFLLSKIS